MSVLKNTTGNSAPLIAGVSNSEKRRLLVQGLARLGELPEGWDTYGGKRISERARNAAFDLAMLLIPKESDFYLVPCSDGGVQIEWHRDGLDVEIYVAASASSPEATPE